MTAQPTRMDSPGTRLGNGDVFPSLQLAAVGGATISLPGDLAGSFGVVLFYRGSWCVDFRTLERPARTGLRGGEGVEQIVQGFA